MDELKRKIIKRLIRKYLMMKGMSSYLSKDMADEYMEDLFEGEPTSLAYKIRAYRQGFFIGSVKSFKITKKNYKDYLSTYHYNKMFPINGSYRHWINDKLTLRLVMEPYKTYLPHYYYHIMNTGEIIECVDNDHNHSQGVEGIIEYLEEKRRLILKPSVDSEGYGVMKLTFSDGQYHINGLALSRKEFAKKITSTRDTLITEYVVSHSSLAKVYANAGNSLRLNVVRYEGEKPVISHAIQKFGTKASGIVDSTRIGGVYSYVDVETGNYKGVGYDKANVFVKLDAHPDTGLSVQGTIPHWEAIKSKVVEICNYIPQIIYMGIDIIVTEEGFKIIEINSHQAITWFQFEKPLLKDNKAAKFFKDRMKEL